MNEWDAMADFLEESGHPEWAAMARKQADQQRVLEKMIDAHNSQTTEIMRDLFIQERQMAADMDELARSQRTLGDRRRPG